jgi:hypothetical protein
VPRDVTPERLQVSVERANADIVVGVLAFGWVRLIRYAVITVAGLLKSLSQLR